MITFEHLRFLALLIPTWLLIGAAGFTLAVPSKDRIGGTASASESRVYAQVPDCRGYGGVAAQHPEQEFAATWE